MKNKIQECPFCGSSANVEHRPRGFIVRCDMRFALPPKQCPINARTRHQATPDEAIALWNIRPLEAKLAETLEAVGADLNAMARMVP